MPPPATKAARSWPTAQSREFPSVTSRRPVAHPFPQSTPTAPSASSSSNRGPGTETPMNRSALALLAALILSPALQGCEAEQQDRLVTLATWKQATPPAEPRVQTVALTHPVRFP